MEKSPKWFTVVIIAMILAVSGCASPVDSTPTEPSATEIPSPTPLPPSPTPELPYSDEGPWEVTFETEDGIILSGTLAGHGERGLILAPMYPGGAAGWAAFAERATEAGYRSLRFDFRGYGTSSGDAEVGSAPQDIEAAINFFINDVGVEKVLIIGAGEGGTAAIVAAQGRDDIVGLAAVSSPLERENLSVDETDIAALEMPSLWIAARQDLTHDIETLYNAANEPAELWIYEGSGLHGTFLLESADGLDLTERLINFADQVFAS